MSYETPYNGKLWRINFDEVDGYIKNYDGKMYLRLFISGRKHERMFDRIKYLISQ